MQSLASCCSFSREERMIPGEVMPADVEIELNAAERAYLERKLASVAVTSDR